MAEFAMSDEQLEELKELSKPVPYLVMGGQPPVSPQVKANNFWQRLSREMDFDWKTVKPIPGKDEHHFTAEPLPKEDSSGSE